MFWFERGTQKLSVLAVSVLIVKCSSYKVFCRRQIKKEMVKTNKAYYKTYREKKMCAPSKMQQGKDQREKKGSIYTQRSTVNSGKKGQYR